jgi:hypothetical protein
MTVKDFTDDERISHLITFITGFLGNTEEGWKCPCKIQTEEQRQCKKLIAKQKDITSIAHLLLFLLKPEELDSSWDTYKFKNFDAKVTEVDKLVEQIVCGSHKVKLRIAISNRLQRISTSSSENSASSGLENSQTFISTKTEGKFEEDSASLSRAIQSRVTNQSYGMETPPRKPRRPVLATIQSPPDSIHEPLSDTESFDSASFITSTPESTFSPSGLDHSTPFTPPSASPPSKPRVSVQENQNSPSFIRSTRRGITQSELIRRPEFDLPKLRNNEDTESVLDEETGNREKKIGAQRILFTNGYNKKHALGEVTKGKVANESTDYDIVTRSPLRETGRRGARSPAARPETQNGLESLGKYIAGSEPHDEPEEEDKKPAVTDNGAIEALRLVTNASTPSDNLSTSLHRPLKLERYKKNFAVVDIFTALERPPGESAQKEGIVYIAIHDAYTPEDPEDKRQLIKIGFSTTNVKFRYKSKKCEEICEHGRFAAQHLEKFKGAKRVEGLVHAHLASERYYLHCSSCKTRHNEWFLSTLDRVNKVVETWTQFVKMCTDYDERSMPAEARDLLVSFLEPENFTGHLEKLPGMKKPHGLFVFPHQLPLDQMPKASRDITVLGIKKTMADIDAENRTMGAKSPSKIGRPTESDPHLNTQTGDDSTLHQKTDSMQNDLSNDHIVPRGDTSRQRLSSTLARLKQNGLKVVGKGAKKASGAADPSQLPDGTNMDNEPKVGLVRRTTAQLRRLRK